MRVAAGLTRATDRRILRRLVLDGKTEADGTRVWRLPDARLELRVVTPTVVHDRIVGVIDEELAGIVVAAFEDVLTRTVLPHTFHDWSQVVGYSPAARKRLTDGVQALRPKMRSVHILFSSRILAMGISAANVVLGAFIQAHGDPASFRAAHDEAARRC